ncbi:MAG TPA: tripartite tricarboxylate transporter TctB family protein [Burkholderiales bacterium]
MKVNLLENKDFLAGLLMIVIGAIAFYMALDYPFGSALRMGPGYFPRVLAGIFIAFGVYVGLRGLRTKEKVEGIWGWKALALITLAFFVYGWLMDRIGMIPSLVVLFFISALAGHEFRLKEVIILTVVMTTFAWAVFIWGLGMPYRLFWWD